METDRAVSHAAETEVPSMPNKTIWIGRIMSALPVLMLLFSAGMKIARPPAVLQEFGRLGYPDNVALPIGIVELLCAVLYAIPRTSVLGAILLTGYLGGATATHVRMGEPFISPIVFGVFIWGGLFLRNQQLRHVILGKAPTRVT